LLSKEGRVWLLQLAATVLTVRPMWQLAASAAVPTSIGYAVQQAYVTVAAVCTLVNFGSAVRHLFRGSSSTVQVPSLQRLHTTAQPAVALDGVGWRFALDRTRTSTAGIALP
jgi:hypothetical protein